MTWSGKRKLFYGGIILIAIAIFLLIKIYPSLNKEPTCFDGKKNGDERGVDCGGACVKICVAEVTPLVVKWSRSFKVANGYYNAFAYIENQNIQSAAGNINYEFTFFDSENIYIAKRVGSTYVPASGRFGIFEPAVPTGQRIPTTTTFRFLSVPEWEKVSKEDSAQTLFTEFDVPTNVDIAPKLSVIVENTSILPIQNIDVIALIYDVEGNALGVSKTIIDSLGSGVKSNVKFTWREPFAGEARRTEIITQVNPFANRQ